MKGRSDFGTTRDSGFYWPWWLSPWGVIALLVGLVLYGIGAEHHLDKEASQAFAKCRFNSEDPRVFLKDGKITNTGVDPITVFKRVGENFKVSPYVIPGNKSLEVLTYAEACNCDAISFIVSRGSESLGSINFGWLPLSSPQCQGG